MASAAPNQVPVYPVVGDDDVEFPTPSNAIWRQGSTYQPGDVIRCKNNRPCQKKHVALDADAKAEPESDEENLSETVVLF